MVKTFTFNVKSTDTDRGTFTGILSKYGNIDLASERVCKGAYDKTIAENGTHRPLLWSHKQDDCIGSVELVDTDSALTVNGRLNLDIERGREVYSLLQAGDVGAMSVGYIVRDSNYDTDGVRNLTDIKLLEASIVACPCNEECVITAVKSTGGKMSSRYDNLSFLKNMDEEEREEAIKELDALFPIDEEDDEKACEPDKDDKSEDEEEQTVGETEQVPADEPDTDDEEDEKSFNALVKQINAITAKLR